MRGSGESIFPRPGDRGVCPKAGHDAIGSGAVGSAATGSGDGETGDAKLTSSVRRAGLGFRLSEGLSIAYQLIVAQISVNPIARQKSPNGPMPGPQ